MTDLLTILKTKSFNFTQRVLIIALSKLCLHNILKSNPADATI
jgi:hypothetical protein